MRTSGPAGPSNPAVDSNEGIAADKDFVPFPEAWRDQEVVGGWGFGQT